ncbi:MAG: hypothetical protein FWC13_09585 [Oscillospiraceae bacterium]|nr:hypothetical protein [Oscillospiraceae bacterium]
MNYIFDIGNVLVSYGPREYLEELFTDSAIVDTLLQGVFHSEEWLMADKGKLMCHEVTERLCARIPEYRNEVSRLIHKAVTTYFDEVVNHVLTTYVLASPYPQTVAHAE